MRITSLTVRDFRSIRGSVTIPMDGPVVLIHGKNGAGKTSLLSAIELGLTGRLASLERLDPNLREHLVHKQATSAEIQLSLGGLDSETSVTKFHIEGGSISGKPLLSAALARHYSERCYLAQSTLSRLLEMYQTKDHATKASPLTSFVKELLGLDALDNLISGLNDAGDVRRLRGGALRYWEVRDRIPALESEVSRLKKDLSSARTQIQEIAESVNARVASYWPNQIGKARAEVAAYLAELSHEKEIFELIHVRREISSYLDQQVSGDQQRVERKLDSLEAAAGVADRELQQWLNSTGTRLTLIFQDLAAYFADLPSPIQNRPVEAHLVAKQLVEAELVRCTQVLAKGDEAASRLASIRSDRALLVSRLALLDEQILLNSRDSGQLAQALSALLPHIHTEDCPACGRNFAEVSETPLVGHIASQVAALTHTAGRLTSLSQERSDTATVMQARNREIERFAPMLVPSTVKTELDNRVAALGASLISLAEVESDVAAGELLFERTRESALELSYFRARDQSNSAMREAARLYAARFGLPEQDVNQSPRDTLSLIQQYVSSLELKLSGQEIARRDAESDLRELELKESAAQHLSQQLEDFKEELLSLTSAKARGDLIIDQAKELTGVAQIERTKIVRRVFNDSLNTTWRDLFVRLAPDEPFVPSFVLPDSSKGTVEAHLETMYRSGGKGGNPRAMLSAGNLNTAALTLFFALHLTARASLPCLVIDDPVQSMDEIHISQFAALLRTLSKEHGRQIIVAVHEKPLFDYLSLELNAASRGDRLVTAALGRTSDDMSVCECQIRTWRPDLAVAA